MPKVTLTIDDNHPSSKPFLDFIATLDEIEILEINGEKDESIDNRSIDAIKVEIIQKIFEIYDKEILYKIEVILDKEQA